MQPERWQRIEEILQSAIDCAPENRPALLDAACCEDTELRSEIESLLAHEKDGSVRDSSAFSDVMKVLEHRSAHLSEGRKIGAYRILREIGRGGMGNVYRAERDDDVFHKVVALKVIRRGLDLDDIVHRFRGERQILAMLDHPNVARLLDGGATDDGLPYFVMGYIEGEPIDEYCERRNLSVAERLKLFQDVCSAVSYAHQNLIVHRDIKPGNVLVTKEGVPRLLDFGIAKLLVTGSVDQQKTLTGVRPLTPECASPEQVRGETITTASDIYSLGVLLYRLLTGHSPYRSAMSTPAEIERAICDEEPEKPSDRALKESRNQLKGDLDTIVLMALRKDPRRRYASAEQFSEDMRRHLAKLPVAARPDTRRYRAAKFVQRNKPWVAAAILVFLALTTGIAATLWQAHVARMERDHARVEQAKSARINAFLQEMVGYSAVTASTPNHRSHEATVADMLDDAAQRVETELEDQPQVKAEMLGTIGSTYMTQAKYDKSTRFLREAYDLDLKLFGAQARQTAAVMHALGDVAYLSANYSAADYWFKKGLPIYTQHVNDVDFDIHLMPAMLSDAAFVKRALGRLDEAESLWREALTYGPRLPARYRAQGIAPKTFLAQLYVDRGEIEKADALASGACRDLRAFGGDRVSLAQSLIDLGNTRRLQGRYGEADASIQEGTNLFAQALGGDHPNVAYGMMSLAASRYYQARYGLAEQDVRGALRIIEKLPTPTHYHESAYITLGRILSKTGRAREAEPLLREALAMAQQKSRRPLDAALASAGLGECLVAQKRYAEAEPLLVASYEALKTLQIPGSPDRREARERLASLYSAWGRPSQVAF